MELKPYQKDVIYDLSRFLALLVEKKSAGKAYNALWEEKNVIVGMNGMPYYQSILKNNVPDVTFKVPTGGGKTFLAASSIKPIFDAMPEQRAKAVVWLVPSDAILTQTYAALANPQHPYRQKIDVDFGGAVEVYSKAQLLNGQNFNPTTVTEQLSIFVLSYDSFRTSKKDGKKAYQENGNLALFPKLVKDKSVLLSETDETALIQVIRTLNPIVIVDESHHATSTLSVEMLENFNPCFVLDLTATPAKKSNIISFVDAAQLKRANMVKLPVIVYNRKSQDDVYADAISIRHKLELQAKAEQAETGRYIRPIVLFQAQPRVGSESTTYDKIKNILMEAGIPAEEIAIKTGDKDELKNVDLLSPSCPIRYIITVNALKEGWDCPFAYVLATVANRTSMVDVEQILGRILRLPYTMRNKSNVLNISYVITSSSDFGRTLEQVVKGLNSAGFSSKDCRAKDETVEPEQKQEERHEQLSIVIPEDDTMPEVDISSLKERIQIIEQQETAEEVTTAEDEIFASALEQAEQYDEQVNTETRTAIDQAPLEVRDKMNTYSMNGAFAEEASKLLFPQFMLEVEPSLFSQNEYIPLKLEHLEEGFTLKDKDVQIDFSSVEAEIARVDVDDAQDALPKAWQLKSFESAYYKDWFSSQPAEKRLTYCKNLIQSRISKINCVNDKELREYIDRAVDTLSEDQLSDLEQSVFPYAAKIEKKVKDLLAVHRNKQFELWLEQARIACQPNYALSPVISPTISFSLYPNSLYTSEEDVNNYERKMVWALSSMDNIKWWHRNISRLGFMINGPVHAYPDIIAMTKSGKLLMIETKGDHLDNEESRLKAKIGHQWDSLAGAKYRYFMVFETKSPEYPGAYSYDRFMEIIKAL